MYSKSTASCAALLCAGLIVSSACGSSNPAGPSVTDAPIGRSGNIRVSVAPNPVPFDGKPVADVSGCAQRPNTWYYQLTLSELGGTGVVFTEQIDAFDGFVVNDLKGIRLEVPANGEVILNPRWCSATDARHTAQHTFTGVDGTGKPISLQTPVVSLMQK